MDRVLIVNADDLGYTRGINRAVEQCYREGILRSATIMAAGEAFGDAVRMVAENPGLGVGVHLVLTELPPVADPNRVPTLAGANGRLPASLGELALGLVSGRIASGDVREELDAQVEKVVESGIVPTHLDGHKHIHLLPQVLEAVAWVARKYSIRYVRSPFESMRFCDGLGTVDPGARGSFARQHAKAAAVRVMKPFFRRTLRTSGLCGADSFFGISLTGLWTEAGMIRLLKGLPGGVSELMAHPGDCDGDLLRNRTRLRESREMERDILLSHRVRDAVAECGVRLCRYGEKRRAG